jgi:hypothetical protein
MVINWFEDLGKILFRPAIIDRIVSAIVLFVEVLDLLAVISFVIAIIFLLGMLVQ